MLAERDKQLLVGIFENRIMSAEQIGAEFFPAVARQNVLRRLRKLARYGFLVRRMVNPLGTGDVSAFSITPKALERVKAQYPFRVVKDYCKSDSFEHDVELVSVRNRLCKFRSVASYYTENVLQACEDFSGTDLFEPFKNQNTDAAIEVRKNGKTTVVGLEFERSEKTFHRYTKKLFGYYSDERTAVVLYICKSQAIQRVVARAETSVMGSNHPRCFYALLDDVLQSNEKCIFKNLKGATITLD